MNTPRYTICVLIILMLVEQYDAMGLLFLKAITTALATIPFTGGPITGLAGAKLAIGTKLLYYLGYFGKRRSNKKSVPKGIAKPAVPVPKPGVPLGFGGNAQLPLPYAMMGGFQQANAPAGGGIQGQYGGFDPAQLFQALVAQGFDPNDAMQAINYGQFPSNQFSSNQFPSNQFPGGVSPQNPFPQSLTKNAAQNAGSVSTPESTTTSEAISSEDESEDIESFFKFLKDMDENTCISRLVCDIGENPSFLGEFSENIHGIVKSLNVPPTSGAYEYVQIMEAGKNEGHCRDKFPICTDAAYDIVKNVAPSVGLPQNIDASTLNRL